MKPLNQVVEEEKGKFVPAILELQNYNFTVEEQLTQAMHKAALAVLDEAEELAWDYIVTATREESWSRIDLKLRLATLRKQLTDKE